MDFVGKFVDGPMEGQIRAAEANRLKVMVQNFSTARLTQITYKLNDGIWTEEYREDHGPF